MIATAEKTKLPTRWTTLRPHREQLRFYNSAKRFNICPAGRRSGKSERAKRRHIRKALRFTTHPDGWFVFGAPTHLQAKRIFWRDIKAFTPKHLIVGTPSESELSIRLWNGATMQVMGMDQPSRVEGPPLDSILMDEFGNMRQEVWTEHVRPALSTPGRLGEADFIGVPEGRNHYYDLSLDAQANKTGEWGYFHWKSEEILDAGEIAVAKSELDERTYKQEYEGSFESYDGLVYYSFTRDNVVERLPYDHNSDLHLCFDFNVTPGTATAIQEFRPDEIETLDKAKKLTELLTCVIEEFYISKNSNTLLICTKIIDRFKDHKGLIFLHGDATGGAGGSAKVMGSDWDLITRSLKVVFGDQLRNRVPSSNPRERVRVNAVNSRIKSSDGTLGLLVDPKCRFTVKDMEGTPSDGAGGIDKKSAPMLSHLSDEIGYYIHSAYPIRRHVTTTVSAF